MRIKFTEQNGSVTEISKADGCRITECGKLYISPTKSYMLQVNTYEKLLGTYGVWIGKD